MAMITTNFDSAITRPQQHGRKFINNHRPACATRHPQTRDWDFKGANTKLMTHCFYAYPAMMIPQIAERLIHLYGQDARVLFDPYCGTGTSLVEANVRGIYAKGSDLNPLARLVATAKTRRLQMDKVASLVRRLQKKLSVNACDALPKFNAPVFRNIDFWFPRTTQKKLSLIKFHIDKTSDYAMRNFLLVAFSETVRECSYTRNGEFKLYRIPEQQRKVFEPDVVGIFLRKIMRNQIGLQEFVNTAKTDAGAKIFDFNTVDEIPTEAVARESVDIVVTSPPYGDSGTTVAYGQFSRLANEWLGVANAAAVDRRLMGGRKLKKLLPLGDTRLDEAIDKVSFAHHKRALEVCGFYYDYRKSIGNVAAAVKPGGVACYVVGNRRVKGVTLPTDCATESYFKENGFVRERVFTRNIPNKRMPARNSPTNVRGATDTTMCREHILIMRKPR